MTGPTFEAFAALGLGFAFAGLVASGFEALSRRPLRLASLQRGNLAALACLPVVIFSAPFLILRNIVAGRRSGVGHIPYVMLTTLAASFWGLMSGRVVFDLARYLTGA